MAKSSGLKMAACGIAANGGVRCHGRHFPGALCVPLHGQFLVAPFRHFNLDFAQGGVYGRDRVAPGRTVAMRLWNFEEDIE